MTPIKRNFLRFQTVIARTSLLEIPILQAVAWELPRSIGARAYKRLASIAYSLINRHRILDRDVKQCLDNITDKDGCTFYYIVVPSVLHFLIPSAQLIRRYTNLVFILNGINDIEENTLRKIFPDIPIMRVWTFPKTVWPHGHVLSLLLRVSERDFGICDHDFYLFNSLSLNQLIFKEDEFAICVTSWRNRLTGIDFPGTHFLYLRAAIIRKIMERHDVSAQLYKKVPKKISPVLTEMGLSVENPPKDYQSFFDSFLMLSSLAVHDGLRIRKLGVSSQDWEHIGGTSIGVPVTKNATYHYASCLFLGFLPDVGITQAYKRRGLVTPEKAEMLRTALDPIVANRVDKLVERIRARDEVVMS